MRERRGRAVGHPSVKKRGLPELAGVFQDAQTDGGGGRGGARRPLSRRQTWPTSCEARDGGGQKEGVAGALSANVTTDLCC